MALRLLILDLAQGGAMRFAGSGRYLARGPTWRLSFMLERLLQRIQQIESHTIIIWIIPRVILPMNVDALLKNVKNKYRFIQSPSTRWDALMTEEKKLWGKLVAQTRGLATHALKQKTITMGRNPDCQVVVAEKRLSSKHCMLQIEDGSVYLTDMSTNGTYLNDSKEKVGKGNRIQIQDEATIWLLPSCRVPKNQAIGFKMVLLADFKEAYDLKRAPLQEKMEGQEERKEQEQLKEEVAQSRDNFLVSLKEQITCCYCFEIMVFPVSIQPCNHRLCGPCLTELVSKKKDECIVCRRKMGSAARDASFNTIIDQYLRSHPNQYRKSEDESPNIFGHEPKNIRIIIHGEEQEYEKREKQQQSRQHRNQAAEMEQTLLQGLENIQMEQEVNPDEKKKLPNKKQSKKQSKKQTKNTRSKSKKNSRFLSSDISASTDQDVEIREMEIQHSNITCKECVEERKEFKCKPGQPHTNCHNCNKPFAIRDDEQKLYQSCQLCHSFFCNLYLPPCQKNGPKLILLGNRAPTCTIEPIYFRNNKVEMDAFRNLLVSEKKKVGDMFHEMLKLAQCGKFQFMFDRRLLRTSPTVEKRVRLYKRTAVCDNCWRELWFQMIFMYVKEYGYLMPESIKKRPPCYWGINCRTMEHNLEHAKKYNHMEFQTRF